MATTSPTQSPINDPQPLFKKRTAKSTLRKRPATPPPASSSSSGYSSASDEDTSANNTRAIKRQRKNHAIATNTQNPVSSSTLTTDLSATKYTADRSTALTSTNDATKTSTSFDSPLASNKTPPPPPNTSTSSSTTTYKGTSAYQSFLPRNPNAPPRAPIGPVKAPTNVRTITVTDFAPDVCKDYKQTGFCGFGDSCKFLHAREDYKQGWELDKEWEKVGGGGSGARKSGGQKTSQRKKEMDEGEGEGDDEAMLENIPFACIICKEGYKDPIVTKCGHYFCEKCALQRYRRNPSCAACGAGTGGVFNGAKGLKKLLERKRERARVRREKAVENGEEVGSEEEEGREG
ncbi:MAG: hypothetical protein Q9219_002400 [cf. Caloplaca sp. 3 TL-2023]